MLMNGSNYTHAGRPAAFVRHVGYPLLGLLYCIEERKFMLREKSHDEKSHNQCCGEYL